MVNAIGVFFFLHRFLNNWPGFLSNGTMRGADFYRLSGYGLREKESGLAFKDTVKHGRQIQENRTMCEIMCQ